MTDYVAEPYESDKERFRLVSKFENEIKKIKKSKENVRWVMDTDFKKMLVFYKYSYKVQ
jgi:hypothetical protein